MMRNIGRMAFFAGILFLLAAECESAQAALVFQDNFEGYNSGALAGQGAWSGSGGTAATIGTHAGLAWSGGGTTISGGPSCLTLTNQSSYKDYCQNNSMTAVNADAVYFSFLVQGTGLNNSGDDTALRIANNVGVGYSYDNGSPVIYLQIGNGKYATVAVENDVTYFVVAKLSKSTTGTGSNYDTWTLYLNPTSDDESLNVAVATLTGSVGRSYLTTPRFWGDFVGDTTDKAVYYDDLLIGTSFSDVVAVPEPAAITLLALGATAMLRRRKVSGRA